MRKDEVRSLVRNTLPKWDKTNRWGDRYIDGAIEKARAELLEEVWRINPLNLQRYTKGFGYVTPVTVALESGTNLYYSILPESIHPFQDKSSGCRRVSTIAQGAITFIPMDSRETDLVANGSFFDTVNTKIGYIVNGERIEYYNMSVAVASVGVRMDLIVPFSKYDETDEVLIPEIVTTAATANARVNTTFVDRVMKILGVVAPVDTKDDNDGGAVQSRDN